jgi:hypothetical protein
LAGDFRRAELGWIGDAGFKVSFVEATGWIFASGGSERAKNGPSLGRLDRFFDPPGSVRLVSKLNNFATRQLPRKSRPILREPSAQPAAMQKSPPEAGFTSFHEGHRAALERHISLRQLLELLLICNFCKVVIRFCIALEG